MEMSCLDNTRAYFIHDYTCVQLLRLSWVILTFIPSRVISYQYYLCTLTNYIIVRFKNKVGIIFVILYI